MTTYGPFYPSSVVSNNSGGGVAWNSPGNGATENAIGTDCTLTGGQLSEWLVASGFDFSTVPDDANITGVLIEWKKRRFLPLVCDDLASRMLKGGVIGTADRSIAGHWPVSTGFVWTSYGGAGDTFDGVTVADIKASGCGAALRAKEVAGDSHSRASVDTCRITILVD